MATVYIAEFRGGHVDHLGFTLPVARMPPIAEQTVAIGGASAQSAAFNADTELIRVHTDAICSILVGANPTAAATNARLAAGQTEYFFVARNSKLAVITNS